MEYITWNLYYMQYQLSLSISLLHITYQILHGAMYAFVPCFCYYMEHYYMNITRNNVTSKTCNGIVITCRIFHNLLRNFVQQRLHKFRNYLLASHKLGELFSNLRQHNKQYLSMPNCESLPSISRSFVITAPTYIQ